MLPEEHAKTEYEAPAIMELGDAAELTTGNGRSYTDYLGDTSTNYG